MQNREPTQPLIAPHEPVPGGTYTEQAAGSQGSSHDEPTSPVDPGPGAPMPPAASQGARPVGPTVLTGTAPGAQPPVGHQQPPPRKWLLPLLIVLLGLLLLSLVIYAIIPHSDENGSLLHGTANGNNYTDTGPKSFHVGDHPLLVIKGHNSDVNIHTGNAATVVVRPRKHGSNLAPDPNTTRMSYSETHDEQGHDRIVVSTDPGYQDVDYDITAPSNLQVQVTVNSGAFSVSGIAGVTIDTGNGSLDVEDIQGPVNVHTESGDITARNLKGTMDVEAGSGSLRLNNVTGSLKAITRSGDVIVRQGSLSGQSILQTNSGSVRFAGALDPRGSYRLETNSGDVDLTLPGNAAFQLAAGTGSGSVHNDFGSNTIGSTPQAQIVVSVGSGSITVNKAA